MRLSEDRFVALVADAIRTLPPDVLGLLENIEVIADDWPSDEQLEEAGIDRRSELLGLYEGVPLTLRTVDYGLVPPDRISVFRGPLLITCRTESELRAEVRQTVLHELAHHFGIDDDRLDELGAY